MKTTLVPRHAHPVAADPRRPVFRGPRTRRWSTTQLGLVVSAVSVVVAMAIEVVADVPRLAIVAAVTVVAFAVSWHASGHH